MAMLLMMMDIDIQVRQVRQVYKLRLLRLLQLLRLNLPNTIPTG